MDNESFNYLLDCIYSLQKQINAVIVELSCNGDLDYKQANELLDMSLGGGKNGNGKSESDS